MATSQVPALHRSTHVPNQNIYHIHYPEAPATENGGQTHVAQQVYDAVYQALNHVQSSAQVNAFAQASQKPKKDKTKYYKPTSTETWILSLFLISSLVFIAGIKFMLRRSVSVSSPDTLGSLGGNGTFTNVTAPVEAKIIDSGPSSFFQGSHLMSCIGVERIVSITNTEECITAADKKGKHLTDGLKVVANISP